jgi:hypothetical protein
MIPIAALIGSITQFLTGWVNGKLEIQKAKIETQKAAEANKTRLLADTESNNHAWEMAQLADADKLLRRICFTIFSFPFIWAIFDPISVANYFNKALSSMPSWYIQTYMGMVGAVWGWHSIKDSISQVVNQLKK